MYRLAHKQGWSYTVLRNKPLIISNGRGAPVIFSYGQHQANANVVMYHPNEWTYNDNPLVCNRSIPLLDALSASSAYLGPLADYSMCRVVNAELLGMYRFFMQWRKSKRTRVHHLAPLVHLNHRAMVRTCDGCLWDNRALTSCLYGLRQENAMKATPVVIVVTSDPSHTKRWWSAWWSAGRKKSNILMTEATYFEGDARQYLVREYRSPTGDTYGLVFRNCAVAKASNPLSSWLQPERIDLVVIGILSTTLNSIPFNKRGEWNYFHRTVKRNLRRLWGYLRIDALARDRVVGVAISGGGARTAIVGYELLHSLEAHRIYPVVVAGNSGGSWAIALYAMHAAGTDIVEVFFRNLNHLFHVRMRQRIILSLIRYIQGSVETGETFTYILPMLSRVDFDWREVVRHIIFDNNEQSWNIFERFKFRIVIPATILCNSHVPIN